MKRFRSSILILLLAACISLPALSQEIKIERETRVKSTVIPQASVNWINASFPDAKRIRWYQEVTSGKKSYEAKFKALGTTLSVEFSEEGFLEDVEINKKLKQLPNLTKEALSKSFLQFEKFKIVKLQEQWTGTSPELIQKAALNNDPSQITVRFEIVFRAKIDGKQGIWEGLFDGQGTLLRKKRIVLRPTDNLDY